MRPVFESERISFIEVSELLIPDYLAMVNDFENVGRMAGRTTVIDADRERKWVRRKLEEKAPIFSMMEKESGRFIGNIEFMDLRDDSAELGIAITAGMQDRGFGTEAIPAMIEYGRNELMLKRIVLKVFPFNARAVRVYEKCGFREYGRTENEILMELV